MTLQQLKYISMVEKCGSFSKAAQKLYVSQPSVSSLVHALEEELGITVFTRSSSGIAITNEGRQLLKLSNKLLRDADYIDEYFQRSAEGPKPSFFISSQHYDFVVSAFEEFVGGLDADRYTLGLNQNQTSVVIESVCKQSSDLGVIFLSDVNRRHMERLLEDNNLAFHRLVQARPHAFLSVTHPLAGRRSIRTDELMEYPCIVYEQTADSPGFFSEEMMLPNFYPPKVVYISDLYVSTALMRSRNAYDVGTGVISPRLAREVACVPIGTEDITNDWLPRFGIEHDSFDAADLSQLEPLIRPNTRVIYVETPANPTMVLVDLQAVAEIAHRHGAKLFVDNTFATPYNTNPLDLGADVVIHSLTKYIGGHGDLLGGAVISNDEQFLRQCRLGTLMHFGAVIAPFTAFLVCRGMKTLGVRMRQHNESAPKIARWLESDPRIETVRYPLLESNPQYEIARRQMRGGGGMITFDVRGGLEAGKRFINHLKLCSLAVSLGDTETLAEQAAAMTHTMIPREVREAAGITDGMIRMSVGPENADDIIADLKQALDA